MRGMSPGCVRALVGADGDRTRDAEEGVVSACRQRLLDQLEAGLGGDLKEHRQIGAAPALVGIGDEARIGARCAHGAHAVGIGGRAELDLEEALVGRLPGLLRHRVWPVEAQRSR